jgi:hypothetical protein
VGIGNDADADSLYRLSHSENLRPLD